MSTLGAAAGRFAGQPALRISAVKPHAELLDKLSSRRVEFVIDTELPIAIVLERLQAVVEPRNAIIAPLVPTKKLFAGKVTSEGFRIMRIIGYGSGSLPVIVGHSNQAPRACGSALLCA